jgi:type IV pilus assembly protein PilW
MIYLKNAYKLQFNKLCLSRGFTLIELMVGMAVTSILLAGIYTTYNIQTRSYKTQTMMVSVQQNLRGALIVMEEEIRMAGYDSGVPNTGLFGLTNITIDGNGNGTITFTGDFGIGNADNGILENNETFSYSIYDSGTTQAVGNLDLGRALGGGGRQLLAEGIEAMGFAFAYDNDADQQLDTDGGGNVLWGIDTDADNVLDTNVAGGGLPTLVNMNRIRAVRVWLLARTRGIIRQHYDTDTYVVGNRTLGPFNDGFQRILLTSTVKLRNIGL